MKLSGLDKWLQQRITSSSRETLSQAQIAEMAKNVAESIKQLEAIRPDRLGKEAASVVEQLRIKNIALLEATKNWNRLVSDVSIFPQH